MKFHSSRTLPYVIITFISLGTLFSACTNEDASKSVDKNKRANHSFATVIEDAHNMSAWNKKGVLRTNLDLSFGDSGFAAELYIQTRGPGVLLELTADTAALFDGQEMYSMPSDSAVTPFELKTWAYFLKAPYKLNDPGTIIELQDTTSMNGRIYDRAKMTFEPGTGDTPEDWYILYRDRRNNRLRAMAYIVTAGSTPEEASKNPHAITYEDFEMIEGIPIATTWKFWMWSADKGFPNEPIGQATLSNIEFLEPNNLFAIPDGAKRMKR